MVLRRGQLAALVIYALIGSVVVTPGANAATVTSSNADASGTCSQIVDNATSIVVNRYSADCVISFKRVGTTEWTIPAGVTKIQTLIIAGGGGGGYDVAGGGGAGGLLYYGGETPKTPNGDTLTVTSGSILITVGGGGAGATSTSTPFGSDSTGRGVNGSNSSITLPSSTVLTAIGGGGGNSRNNINAAQNGGSGGGGGYGNGSPTAAGSGTGSGTTLQGYGGGRTTGGSGAGGGGGGAGGAGVNWSDGNANLNGAGGVGLQYLISGTATFYGGGGGAGSWNNLGGPGGTGGGGTGGSADNVTCRANCSTLILAQTGNAGIANTGGGGGGSGKADASAPAGAGGSGVVIIRYTLNLTSAASIAIPGGGFIYNTSKNISAVTNTSGLLTFMANGKFIAGCRNIITSSANSYTGTCAYKPKTHGNTTITVIFRPSDLSYSPSSAVSASYFVAKRTSRR